MTTTAVDRAELARLRAARLAVAVTFFVNGAVFASWTPRIPAVKAELGLGEAALGLALLGPAVGAVVAMPLAGALATRLGSRFVTRAALVAFCALPGAIGLAGSPAALVATLAGWGAAMGALDVAMNTAGMAVQSAYGRPVLSGFHAAFSAGGLAGAALGSVAAALGVGVAAHLAVTGAAGLALAGLATQRLLPAGADARAAGPLIARPTRGLLVLGGLAFAGLLAEGAAADWSAVYLHDWLGTSAGVAGAGYVAFSLAMTAGRVAGDRLVLAAGPVRVVRTLAAVAAGGLGLALVVGEPWAAVLGFGALGAGLACVVPVVFTAAARRGPAPGPALAAVSSCGYLGFVAGPPLIGALAGLAGLPAALGLVVALTALVALLAGATAPARASG
jgi:predicted MFS family arabinose efflux permease